MNVSLSSDSSSACFVLSLCDLEVSPSVQTAPWEGRSMEIAASVGHVVTLCSSYVPLVSLEL